MTVVVLDAVCGSRTGHADRPGPSPAEARTIGRHRPSRHHPPPRPLRRRARRARLRHHRRRRPGTHRRPRPGRHRPTLRCPQPVRRHDPRHTLQRRLPGHPGRTDRHDVFTQCLIADWIDRPAHSRQAELSGEPPHRAGLLDGSVLRDVLKRRHQLADELQRAEARQQRLPAEIHQTQGARTAAEQEIVALRAEQHRLEGVISDFDRPLRRHRHHDEIDSARRHLADIPYRIDKAQGDLVAADDTLDRLNTGATETRAGPRSTGRHRDRDRRPRRPARRRPAHPDPSDPTRATPGRRRHPWSSPATRARRTGLGHRGGTPRPTPSSVQPRSRARSLTPTTGAGLLTATATKPWRNFSSRSSVQAWTDRSSYPTSAYRSEMPAICAGNRIHGSGQAALRRQHPRGLHGAGRSVRAASVPRDERVEEPKNGAR